MKVRLKLDIDHIGKRGEAVDLSEDDARIFICAGYASGYKEPAVKQEAEEKEQAPVENTGRKRRFSK